MNIFGLGGWELLLVVMIMVIVAGPKRMIRWSYVLGQYTAKLQRMWRDTAVILQREFDDAGLDVKVPSTPPTRQSLQQSARELGQKVMGDSLNPIQEVSLSLRQELQDAHKDVKTAQGQVEAALQAEAPPSTQAKPTEPPKSGLGNWGGKAS